MSGTTRRQRLARGATLSVALPLSASLLLAAAPAAGAAVNQPVDGAEFTSYRTVEIVADYGGSLGTGTERLLVTAPGAAEVEVAAQPGSTGGGTLRYVLDLACWTPECRLAPNGTWTVRQAGTTADTSSFSTRLLPVAPSDVRATALSPREVQLSWRRGPEPDLTGWDVYEGAARVVAGVARSACSGSTCSTVIRYAAAGSGEHTFTVRALRATAPGSSTTLESPPSAPASARLDDGPGDGDTGTGSGGAGSGDTGTGADGTGSGGSGSGSSGSGSSSSGGGVRAGSGAAGPPGSPAADGGSAPGGTGTTPADADQQALAQRKASALGFSAFGPKLGVPKLPPLPQAQQPAIATEPDDGTFEPTLGFEDQVLRERVEIAASPTQRVSSAVGGALDSERLLRSTAAALVLLLAGAHLRRWLGAAHDEA